MSSRDSFDIFGCAISPEMVRVLESTSFVLFRRRLASRMCRGRFQEEPMGKSNRLQERRTFGIRIHTSHINSPEVLPRNSSSHPQLGDFPPKKNRPAVPPKTSQSAACLASWVDTHLFFFSDFSRYLVAESWLGAAISALQGAVPADRRGTAQADGLAELGKGARVCRRSTWKNWKKKQKNRLITVYYVYLLTVL